jgi:hypothetical protein
MLSSAVFHLNAYEVGEVSSIVYRELNVLPPIYDFWAQRGRDAGNSGRSYNKNAGVLGTRLAAA